MYLIVYCSCLIVYNRYINRLVVSRASCFKLLLFLVLIGNNLRNHCFGSLLLRQARVDMIQILVIRVHQVYLCIVVETVLVLVLTFLHFLHFYSELLQASLQLQFVT